MQDSNLQHIRMICGLCLVHRLALMQVSKLPESSKVLRESAKGVGVCGPSG